MPNKILPKGITTEQLQSNWDTATREYSRAFRRARMLDATDRGRLWESIKATFPKYQLLPDTNHVSYVKNNLLAGIYTVGKSANLIPTTKEDMELIATQNIFLEHYWDIGNVGYFQMQAGERAALTNLGITQVGWDANISGGSGDYFFKGNASLKNIDPCQFMRDPFSTSLQTAAYCMTWDMLHKNILKQNPLYKDSIDAAMDKSRNGIAQPPSEYLRDRPYDSQAMNQKDYANLVIQWVASEGKIHEIHTLNNTEILCVKEDIKPSAYPFALLYCNLASGDLIGTSECAKIFSNSVAYNLMNSVLLTAEYKNQRPPRYVNANSGLNLASFVKNGNEADYTFIVNGDATRAVHYHQFPQPSPNAPIIMSKLGMDIQQVSGVDARYTGRDTGSIQTTGGMEAMLDQATLIDTPKINNYEDYAKQLTKLIMDNYLQFGTKRSYFVKSKTGNKYEEVSVDFPKMPKDTLHQYAISISSEMPKNKARIAQMATTLMEKQAQYAGTGQQVQFITPEEWLMMQDLPNKELMMERMGIQRNQDYLKKISKILFGFAGMTRNGVPPEDAINALAQEMQTEEQPGYQAPGYAEAPEEQQYPSQQMPQQGPEQMF